MNLILHHALKDLRAHKWLVAAWAAMLLALGAIDVLRPDWQLADVSAALAAARVLSSWLIAVRIVHADPLDNTEAFWLTRPISLRSLFAAKAGLIGVLLVAIPGVVVGLVLIGVGVPVAAVPALTVRWLLPELVLLLPIVLVATLTRDLARIVIVLGVMLVAWLQLQGLSASTYLRSDYSELTGERVDVAVAWVGTLVFFAAVVTALIAWHYLTRQRRNTALAAAAGVLLCAGLAWAWPIQLMTNAAREAKGRAWISEWSGGGQLAFRVVEDSLRGHTWAGTTDAVVGTIRVTGLPDGVVFDTLGRSTARLTFPGFDPFVSKDVYWRGTYTFLGVAQSEDTSRVVERVIGARLIDDPGASMSREWGGVQLMQLPPAAYARFQGTPGTFEADLNLMARRVMVAAAIPLRPGSSVQLGDVHTTIAEIQQDARRPAGPSGARYFVIALRSSAPRTVFTRTIGRTGYLLINRRRGEAVPLMGGWRRSGPTSVGKPASFAVWHSDQELFHFIGGESASPDQARWLDKSWLADAELVFLSSEILGKFTRRISVPDFRLPELYIKGDGLPAAGGR